MKMIGSVWDVLYPSDYGLEGLDNYISVVCLVWAANIIGSDGIDGGVHYDGGEWHDKEEDYICIVSD